MSDILSQLSAGLASAVEKIAVSVVQVQGHRRPVAGVVFADDLVAVPARAVADDTAVVRGADGSTLEAHVLGHAVGTGIAVARVAGGKLTPAATAPEPRVGELAIAVGRTWSGNVMAVVTNVTVVGGPLRTGRASELERVIRIAHSPHGALTGGALADTQGRILGVITGSAIRNTTIVIPATLAWAAAHQTVKRGGVRQGYLGIGTLPIVLPARQRGSETQEAGLLITSVAPQSPAEAAGLFVGDVLLRFGGEAVADPETLVTLLRADHVGKPVTLSVLRGIQPHDTTVSVGERPTRRA